MLSGLGGLSGMTHEGYDPGGAHREMAAIGMRIVKMSGRVWLLVAAAFALAMLLAAVPAHACAPVTKASASPSQAEAGSQITVNGTGFNSEGAPVEIRWGGAGGQLLATTAVNEQGNFSAAVTVPDREPGTYWLQARQGSTTANFEFEVTGSSAPEQEAPVEDEPAPKEEPAADEPAAEDGTGDELPPAQQEQASEDMPSGGFEPATGSDQPAQQPQEAASGEQPTAEPAPAPAQQPASPAQPSAVSDPAQQEAAAAPSSEPAGSGTEAEPVEQSPEPAFVGAAAPLDAESKALLAGAEPREGLASASNAEAVEPAETAGDFGEAQNVNGGPSAWVLAPLALLGFGVFVIGGAFFVNEVRHRKERVKA